MADDIRKLVEELMKQQSEKQQELSQETEARVRSILRDYKDIKKVQEELNKLISEGNKKYEDVDEKIKIAKENKNDLVDAERVILELQEEHAEQLKSQFQINQKAYLQVLEQIKLKKEIVEKGGEAAKQATEDLKYLEAKRKILKDTTFDQGREIEKLEKQKKLKEGILSIGKEIWQVSQQYGSELEKHIISISKSNGGYAGLLGNLREAGRLSQAATLGTGITGPENMKALEALSEGFIGLSNYSAQSISNMQVATAQLTKVGVSSASAAKGFDTLVIAMGKTPEQARKIEESFVQMAAKNRLALSAVSQAFAENSSRFVGYGEQMTKVLAGLSEQSLKTGIAISKLVGIAQGFDTFEDASRKVGNLNTLLGGDYFNSIELLTASDEDRIRLLKEGVAASGMQFESMNRFQKMAIANAAGISDLNEAAKLFGQTSLENTRQQSQSADVQKTLAEQAASVSLGMDKLQSTLNGLFIALDPVIEGFRILVDLLVFLPNLASKIGGTFGQVVSAITSVGIFVGLLAIKNRFLGGSWNYIAKSIAKATAQLVAWKATNAPGSGMEGISKFKHGPASVPGAAAGAASPATSATSGLLSNAGNMLKAAGAILLFAAALYVLAKALQELSSKEINEQGIAIAVVSIFALIGVAKLLERVGVSFATGSIAIILIAGSLFLLGVALNKFSGVDWKMVAGIGVLILSLGLAIAGFGMAFSGPQAIFIAIGIAAILAIAVALLILGNSLEKISTSFKTLSELKNIGEFSSGLISFLGDLANTSLSPINDLANAIGLLAENLQKLASVSANMSLNVTGNAKTVLNETVGAAASAVTKTADAVSSAAAARSSQALIPAQQTTAFVPLIVQIDKKTIVEILQKDIEGIARGQAENTLESVGIVQSAYQVQNRVAANSTK